MNCLTTALQEIDWTQTITNYKDHQEFLLKLLTNKDPLYVKKLLISKSTYPNNRLTYYLDKLGLSTSHSKTI